ncbi:MAG: patatin-like phospholipase family protein [Fimbriiglobus sp.]
MVIPRRLLGWCVVAGGLLAAGAGCKNSGRLVPPLDPLRPAAWFPADTPKTTARSQSPADLPPSPKDVPPPAGDLPPVEQAPVRRPQNILVLSGGGSYGAHTAGVLNGWTRSGTRPEFDVVTGISTGALIAPLAFLGSKNDAALRKLYTEVRTKDIFILRSMVTMPFRESLATATPLRKTVETTLTPDVLDEIAAEHRKGRRLLVGTTNLDARRFAVWDIGAIACKGGPDARKLIIDVLIASASVPGVFPPVPIEVEVDGKSYTELHADGGATAPLFVPMQVLEAAAPRAGGGPVPPPPANLYAIVAGKFYADPAPVRARVLKVLGAAAGVYYYGHLRAEVANLYHAAVGAGVKFHVAAMRQDFPTTDSSIEFDPDAMNKLFTEGVRVGVAGPTWETEPPERVPGDGAPIRTGVKYRTVP